ncbi:MAG: hypothetical protein PVG65_04465 [Candidatus Thorarchaeota archaeon]|jgi:hypothetical protein
MKTLIYAFLGIGGAAGVGLLLSKWFGGEIKIRQLFHDLFQKKGKENIEQIEKKQNKIKKKILENEKISKETKEKIKNIKSDANKKIVKVLQEDNLEDLLNEADDLW